MSAEGRIQFCTVMGNFPWANGSMCELQHAHCALSYVFACALDVSCGPNLADDPRTMPSVMHRLSYVFATSIVAVVAATAGWLAAAPTQGRAQSESSVAAGPGLASELRYIGRDTATGMAAPVDDHFIAAVEKSIADYGKDAGTPVPPPPAVPGADVATLTVPALGIDAAPVKRYGVDEYGRLDVPQDNHTVGWNPAYAALPGTGGSTFFAAHYEFGGQPGIFNKLSTLKQGDTITVGLVDGSSHSYRVSSAVDYNLAAIDMGAILQGREGTESITLMTCSGPPGPDGYPLRTVVLAEKIP